MTGYGLLASLAWSGVASALLWRGDRLLSRLLDLMAQAGACGPPASLPATKPTRAQVELPDDLIAYAQQESESWAKDDMKLSLVEKFIELFNGNVSETWQKVRRSVGIGELPA